MAQRKGAVDLQPGAHPLARRATLQRELVRVRWQTFAMAVADGPPRETMVLVLDPTAQATPLEPHTTSSEGGWDIVGEARNAPRPATLRNG